MTECLQIVQKGDKEHQESDSDKEGSLHVTWTSLEEEEEGFKTPTHKPTSEPSPKRY